MDASNENKRNSTIRKEYTAYGSSNCSYVNEYGKRKLPNFRFS